MRSYVYFIEGGGLIKIGVSVRLDRRLKALKQCSPVGLALIGVVRGGEGVERRLHRQFAKDRSHGEWFAPSEELVIYMARFANEYDPECIEKGIIAGLGVRVGDGKLIYNKPQVNA